MPRRKTVWRCGQCSHTFRTERAVRTHRGMRHSHRQAAEPHPRARFKGAPAPIPPPFPEDWPPAEGGDDEGAECDEDMPGLVCEGEDEEEEEEQEEEDPLAQARAYARRLLRAPGWEQWAQDTLHWCEENWLDDVEKLFPEAQDFPTPETYRYLRLWAQHPGAAFASELLKADQKEHLDLSKVAHLAHVLMCW